MKLVKFVQPPIIIINVSTGVYGRYIQKVHGVDNTARILAGMNRHRNFKYVWWPFENPQDIAMKPILPLQIKRLGALCWKPEGQKNKKLETCCTYMYVWDLVHGYHEDTAWYNQLCFMVLLKNVHSSLKPWLKQFETLWNHGIKCRFISHKP